MKNASTRGKGILFELSTRIREFVDDLKKGLKRKDFRPNVLNNPEFKSPTYIRRGHCKKDVG